MQHTLMCNSGRCLSDDEVSDEEDWLQSFWSTEGAGTIIEVSWISVLANTPMSSRRQR